MSAYCIFLLGIVVSAIELSTGQSSVQSCKQCRLIGIVWQCTFTDICSLNEVCFVQELMSTGTVHMPSHHGGCISRSFCGLVSKQSFHQDYRHVEVVAGACCFTDNCNDASILSAPQTSPPAVTATATAGTTSLQCMQCVNEGTVWNCDHVQQCASGQSCFVQELDLSISIPTLADKYFHGGCVDTQRCSTIATTSMSNEFGLAAVANGECCTTDNCNKQIMEYYKNPTTTVSPATTNSSPTMPVSTSGVTATTSAPNSSPTISESIAAVTATTAAHPNTSPTISVPTAAVTATSVPNTPPTMPVSTSGVTATTAASNTSPTVSVSTAAVTAIVGAMSLQCMQCVDEGFIWNCDHVQQCASGQSCYVQELDMSISIPALPDKYFHGGCVDTQRCSTIATVSMSDENGLATIAKGECCTTDNCNKQIMEYYKNPTSIAAQTNQTTNIPQTHPATTPTIRNSSPTVSVSTAGVTATSAAPNSSPTMSVSTASVTATTAKALVRQCMECVNEGVSWKCGYNQTCSNDQVCFIQELKLNIDIPSLVSNYFHAGCISISGCNDISTTSVDDEHGLATVTHGQCCFSDNCNKQLWTDYQNRK